MAAGGFKTFTTGEVLTAADTNNFLMQGVLVFDDAAARDAAITAPVEGQVVYLKDTNAVLSYDGTSYVGVGGSSPLTTKGDLYTFSTVDARLGVGANDTVLTADSAEATGLKWAAPAGGGGMTQIATGSFTGSSVLISSIPTTYKDLALVVRSLGNSINNENARIRFNNDSSASRHYDISAYATTSNTAFNGTYASFSTDSNNTNDISLAYVYFPDYTNTATWKMFWSNSLAAASTSTNFNFRQFVGMYNQTTAITSLGFIPQNGTFTSGSYILYGVE
jgi:hypothetical protein